MNAQWKGGPTTRSRASVDAPSASTRLLGGSRWGWNLIGGLAALLGVAVVATWVETSYFGIDVAGSVSFPGHDGWCRLSNEALGKHCWGDYGAIRFHSLTTKPSGVGSSYPISTRFFRVPFWILDSATGSYRAGLVFFLLVAAFCLMLPVLWAVKDTPLAFKPLPIGVACIATTPFLTAMDRGNLIALAVPFLFLFLLGLVRNRPWMAAGAIVAAASIKPQYALLIGALLVVRQWRPALTAFAGTVAALTLPYFVLFGTDGPSVFSTWTKHARTWSRTQPLSVGWPQNLSLPRTLYAVFRIPDPMSVRVMFVFGAVLAVALLWLGSRMHPFLIGTVFLVLASLMSPLSYEYYAVFLLPIVAVIFRLGPDAWPRRDLLDRSVTFLLSVGIVLGLAPLLIPLGTLRGVPNTRGSIVVSLVPLLSTTAFFLLLVAVFAQVVRTYMRRQNDESGHGGESTFNVSTRADSARDAATARVDLSRADVRNV